MLVLLIVSTVLSVSLGDKTFGEVRQCTSSSFGTCKDYCLKYHPNYKDFDKVQQCFETKRSDFESCMQKQGVSISDSTSCYPMSSSRKRTDSGATSELNNAAKCYKRCLKRAHKRCRKDCTGQPSGSEDDRRSKLRECKNDDQILDCLEGEGPINSNNNNNNNNNQPTTGFGGSDPFPTVTYNN